MKRKWSNYVGAAKKAWKVAKTGYGIYKGVKAAQKNYPKSNKSYTTAKTRRRQYGGGDSTLPGPAQLVIARRNRVPRYLKPMLKTLALRRRISYNSNRITSSVGTQGYAYNPLLTKGDTDNLITDNSLSLGAKIFLRKMKAHTLFTNQTNAVVMMTIYTVIPRSDNNSAEDPITMWTAGNTNEGSDANASTYPGSTPYQSALFCKNYLVKNVKKVRLAAGQTYENTCIAYVNRPFNTDTTSNDYYDPRHTVLQMYVVHGFPQNDSTTKTQISLGATAVDFISSYTIDYYLMNEVTRTRTDIGQAYASAFTVGGLVMTYADTNADNAGVA